MMGARARGSIGSYWRPLCIVLATVLIMVAVWFWLAFVMPRHETLDQRVRDVASQLRCPVCQGESVEDSSASIAQQMRSVIREQLQQGRSEQEVIQYFASRYGEQNIVWAPPWHGFSILAWLVPMTLLLGGAFLLLFVVRDWLRRSYFPSSQSESREPAEIPERSNEQHDDGAWEIYRAQVEKELAAEDVLFQPNVMEGS
ncbi:MAG TPA: cytochrome c-type biogenesis protein CcmH [Dictyobacter sp.]|jgi:cytochrome c-type biogenesis protein CcmH|nr:cytochrome c-type biogenesis protein CcmH [Dictyobacter sp.]